MATGLLVLIYLTFISLGLPDAVLGAGWPAMQSEFGIPYGHAGLVHMIVTGGTILSSFFTGPLTGKFGIGKITACSVALTAVALLGFFLSPSFWWLPLAAIPLGLGAGAVDAGLNAFVAARYESRHMSWLHCFWGLGALTGPLALSHFLSRGGTWRDGYLTITILQFILVAVLVCAIPLWAKVPARAPAAGAPPGPEAAPRSFVNILRLPGTKWTLATFLIYCGIEATVGLWGGSFLFKIRGCDAPSAARWVAMFYASITLGRFLTGFATYHFTNATLIRTGTLVILGGTALMLAPLPLPVALTGLALTGFGCAPIFPCLLHETPVRFGQEHAQTLIGIQMAAAYIGSTLLPPLLGLLASATSLAILPAVLLGYACILLLGAEKTRGLKAG